MKHNFYKNKQDLDVLSCIQTATLSADDVEPTRTDQTFYIPIDVQVRNFIASGQSVMAVRSKLTTNLPVHDGKEIIDDNNNILDDQYPDKAEMPQVTQAIYARNRQADEDAKKAKALEQKKKSDKEFVEALTQTNG